MSRKRDPMQGLSGPVRNTRTQWNHWVGLRLVVSLRGHRLHSTVRMLPKSPPETKWSAIMHKKRPHKLTSERIAALPAATKTLRCQKRSSP